MAMSVVFILILLHSMYCGVKKLSNYVGVFEIQDFMHWRWKREIDR